ncbi:MAG: diguanylate cyclase domain-containing protein, partial [Saccharofermentanales bacterium]
MKYSLLVSTLYYICGCFYLVFGTYTIASNTKSKANRLFLLLTSSMAIWSFTYAISSSAPTAESSAFWRCMSVFGWSFFHSLLLHFALILTNYKFQINKLSDIFILYLPSFINVILFAPFGFLADNQYIMVQTDFGWVNTLPANAGQIWINVYYIVYTVITVILLIRWWKNIEPHTPLKRQVTYFLLAILLPLILGSITDILPGMLGIKQIPRLTLLFLIIPTIFLFITLKRFGVLIERPRTEFYPSDLDVLPEEDRLRLFETAAAIFSIGAVGSFFAGYFIAGGNLAHELSLAFVVLGLGIFLRFIPYIVKEHTVQNTLFLITSIVGMSAFIIGNIATGAVTVWAVYVIFLLYTVVINSDIHTIIFMVATLIIQVVLGIIHPEVNVIIDSTQYLKRIFIIVLSYFAVRYLTNEYASKLKGYQRFVQEQEVLERISTSFISVSSESAKETTDKMLEMSADILGFNHAYIIEFDEDYEDATILNTCVKNVKSASFPFYPGMKVKTATLPMSQSLITKDAPVTGEDFAHLAADEAAEQQDFFLSRGVHSFCALPIPVDKHVKAILVVEYYNRIDKSIRERQLYFLKMMANILGDAKQKTLYEDMLYDYAYFDETTKLANRNMLKKILEQTIHDRKGSEKIAVLDIELENLRMINDTFGHSVGEQIMAGSAGILENLLGGCCDIS